jgi:hypothetical protein
MAEGTDETVVDPATLETVRDAIADTIHATADTLHEHCRSDAPASDTTPDWGLRTAEWLDRLSEDLRQWDVRGSESRFRAALANNPGTALLLASATGLIVGRLLRRR